MTLVIVDPFSSGAVFARRARELYGIDSIAVITSTALPASVTRSYVPGDFVGEVTFTDVPETVAAVEKLCGGKPKYILCGSEPGVEVFDTLATHWDLRPNSGESAARRDKFLMQRRLADAGVRHIPHHQGSNTKSIVDWCASSGLAEFVVKPVRSFGTDGVFFCSSLEEVRVACDKLFGRSDFSGKTINDLLVEERLIGPEFVVDSVSLDGTHFVVNMFRYAKETVHGSPVYRTMSSVEVGEYPEIVEYVRQALTALGIDHGPAHSEIIVTAEGPTLIETGARMHGGQGPKLVEASSTHSLIDLALASRVAPEVFHLVTQTQPKLHKGVVECFLSSARKGVVRANRVRELCGELDSFLFDTCGQVPGDHVPKTTDLITSYGRVVLANADLERLKRDTEHVLDLDDRCALLVLED
ncbi:ATP-grasp domain-containing protein [Gandjariella thermophila]|uniref:ATP-grasp domain-containing protein n=1 Tax=Gandjariella thermophila TaxID=1931992 RepID=A0A4D4JJC0_9PSEU|nr:ATP-grasp domain-containing protein [Gandjariella thermophila]GDY34003.1 ATP-grasp domain-containing protein [Gandjariella thermophila]